MPWRTLSLCGAKARFGHRELMRRPRSCLSARVAPRGSVSGGWASGLGLDPRWKTAPCRAKQAWRCICSSNLTGHPLALERNLGQQFLSGPGLGSGAAVQGELRFRTDKIPEAARVEQSGKLPSAHNRSSEFKSPPATTSKPPRCWFSIWGFFDAGRLDAQRDRVWHDWKACQMG